MTPAPEKIREADWFGKLELDDGLILHAVPARHYSGRLLTRNKTLWAGFTASLCSLILDHEDKHYSRWWTISERATTPVELGTNQ